MSGSTITAKATDHHHTGQIAEAAARWRTEAACRGLGHLMDPPPRARTTQRQWEAQDLCMTCPVLNACLHWVLALPEDLDPGGVCGGLTEKERARRRAADNTRFKHCPRCKTAKLRSHDFYTDVRNTDGLQSWCKPCMRAAVNASKDRTKGSR